MTKDTHPPMHLSDGEVRVLPPDYSLKKIVGEDVDLHRVIDDKAVEKVQESIDQYRESFLRWVKKDMQALHDHYREASEHIPACGEDIRKLAKAAFVVKSQAGTFGFGLASQVAKSLDDFCTRQFRPIPQHMVVIDKHIEALAAIFHKNITGDGDALGNTLLASLTQLVEKYKGAH